MENIREILQQEFIKRSGRNQSYSLRAYAKHLDIHPGTLSTLMSGKRTITKATANKIALALNLNSAETIPSNENKNSDFVQLSQDVFNSMSEWYFDAILELSLIKDADLSPEAVAKRLGISKIQASCALETLQRLQLLQKTEDGHQIAYQNSTNIIDDNLTTAAQKKYQENILEKSVEALRTVPLQDRSHTSTTIAINKDDLLAAKKLINNFRQELNAFLQRSESSPNEVYQLQVSFFPLTKDQNLQE